MELNYANHIRKQYQTQNRNNKQNNPNFGAANITLENSKIIDGTRSLALKWLSLGFEDLNSVSLMELSIGKEKTSDLRKTFPNFRWHSEDIRKIDEAENPSEYAFEMARKAPEITGEMLDTLDDDALIQLIS